MKAAQVPDTGLSRFNQLNTQRSPLVSRWEQYAKYSIPGVFPEATTDHNTNELPEQFDSVTASCVNNLANKVMLANFGSVTPFARLQIPDAAVKAKVLEALSSTDVKLEEILSVAETDMLRYLASTGSRPVLFEIIKHLIVLGNVTLDLRKDDSIRAIPVSNYVVTRSVSGAVLEMLYRETVSYHELDEQLRDQLPPDKVNRCLQSGEPVELITWFKLDGDVYNVTVWADDTKLPDGMYHTASIKVEDCRLYPLTWVLPLRAHYGTSMLEDHRGDMFMLDILGEALKDAAALASVYRWLVSSRTGLDPDEFASAANGAAFLADEGEVKLVTATSAQALDVVANLHAKYESRMAAAFLKTSSMVRDAERVTAEEIRLLANELDTTLGGVYARLSIDLQLPIARWLFRKTALAKLEVAIEPVIVTGVDALGRTVEAERLLRFLNNITQLGTLPPEVRDRLKAGEIISALASAEGLPSWKYVHDDSTAQANTNNRMQAEAAAKAAAAQPQPEPMI